MENPRNAERVKHRQEVVAVEREWVDGKPQKTYFFKTARTGINKSIMFFNKKKDGYQSHCQIPRKPITSKPSL